MRFLRKIKGFTMFDKLRNTAIRESLNIESLLLQIERSQLRRFVLVSRMPQEQLPKQILHIEVSGKNSVERLRIRWFDYIEDLSWNRLGLNPSEIQSVLVDREMWRRNLEVLQSRARNPLGKVGEEKKEQSLFPLELQCVCTLTSFLPLLKRFFFRSKRNCITVLRLFFNFCFVSRSFTETSTKVASQ